MLLSAFLQLQDKIIPWKAEILSRNKIVLGNVRPAQTNDPEVAKDLTQPLQVPNTATRKIIAYQSQLWPFPPGSKHSNMYISDVTSGP